jgi:hypothetical protein
MVTATAYLRPNITIEPELNGSKKSYTYNYQGIHYRVFCSLVNLQDFLTKGCKTWIFECNTEAELEKHLSQ